MKVIYNSRLARAILMEVYHTIMLMGIVFTKLDESEMRRDILTHEHIHVLQWAEVALAYILATAIAGLALGGISPWWLLPAPAAYYVWYGAEYAIGYTLHAILRRVPRSRRQHSAYLGVAFEQEARARQSSYDYPLHRPLFAWTAWLGSI